MNNRKSIVWGSLAAASLVAGGAGAALASAAQAGTDVVPSPQPRRWRPSSRRASRPW